MVFTLILIKTMFTDWLNVFEPIFSRGEHINFFGDVVIFDTTYNTNRYGMIFAPLTGVNHHGQTIIFGCGFLSDETIVICLVIQSLDECYA